MIRISSLVACALAMASTATYAHHAGLDGEPIRVEGVVTEIRMINPHAQILVEEVDEAGVASTWRATGAPPVELRNLGWTADTVPIGARVKITGRPAGLGERVLDLDLIEFEDGRILAVSLPLSFQPGF